MNPTPINFQETINTLKFGYDAGQIKLSLKQNAISRSATKMPRSGETSNDNGLLPEERV